MQSTQTNARRAPRKSTSPELMVTIQPVTEAAAKLKRHIGRFDIYGFLKTVYRAYIDWKSRKVAISSARMLADEMNIVWRKGMSPLRVLIEATLPNVDVRQKSRWVRALEYLHSENVSAKEFRRFVRRHGGISGCARLAVGANRKRRRPRRDCLEGDWSD